MVRWRQGGQQRARSFPTEAETLAFDEGLAGGAGRPRSSTPNVYPYETGSGIRWRYSYRDSHGRKRLLPHFGERRTSRTSIGNVHVRTLMENWAEAVRRGDTSGVLTDHSDDIVMFDVPPPHEDVRGIDAYRETWPPFLERQARGAWFEIMSLDVTAGDEVAYAHGLSRCGPQQGTRRES